MSEEKEKLDENENSNTNPKFNAISELNLNKYTLYMHLEARIPLVLCSYFEVINKKREYDFMSNITNNTLIMNIEAILGVILLFIHSIINSWYLVDFVPLCKKLKEMSSGEIQNIQNFLVNDELLIDKWDYPTISLLISIISLLYLWFTHLKSQPFYNMKLNNIYESLYFSLFSLNIEIMIMWFLNLNKKRASYIFCFVSEVVFLVIGWFLNITLYKYFTNKIVDRIQKKYNQQNVYIEYWNILHGIRLFVSKNRTCFEDYKSIIESINILAEKLLFRVSNLEINYKIKFLIYYSQSCYEFTKYLLNTRSNGNKNGNDMDIGFDSDMVRNIAIGYHIKSVNSLKNVIIELKNLANSNDINSAINYNEILVETLEKAEKYYTVYISKYSFSKEAIKLYSLFMSNIMNEYTKKLEEYEKDKDEINEEQNGHVVYEKSEALSSITSSNGSKRLKILKQNMIVKFQKPIYMMFYVMQIFVLIVIIIGIVCNFENNKAYINVVKGVTGFSTGYQSPYVVSRIKYDVRLTSIGLAVEDRDVIDTYMDDLELNLQFLEKSYIPFIYLRHSTKSLDVDTIKVFNNNAIKEVKNENYFSNILRIQKNARLYIDKFNKTSGNQLYNMAERIPVYFKDNTQNRFGPLYMKAIDLAKADNQKRLNKELNFVYIVVVIMTFFVILINLIDDLDDVINEYENQIQEINSIYNNENLQLVIEDDDKKKKKKNSTKFIRYQFVFFSAITGILFIVPFLSIMLFKDEVLNMLTYLGQSSKRLYYTNSVGLLGFEAIFQDTTSFGIKLKADLIEKADYLRDYDSKLRSGVFGGTLESFTPFKDYLGKPGCVRPKRLEMQCEKREYDDEYTEELANSSLNYILTEYLNKLNEFLGSIETHHIPLSTKENINKGFQLAMNHPFMIFHNKIVHDIAGHTLKYNEIGGDYLAAKTYDFLKYTLILHAVVSVLLILLFLLFISKKIKHQLHIMEVMTDVIFSVPLAVYDSNSKLKNFIETGILR
ncbi:hypothetical protein H8356DRAFT_948004 [Neocallimastix lanati (nom. inval.)]|uniref:Uncharacterized protein n=1 Tax=Neocallimastix californiae TaxID=1754190 RepID=A0A1Y2DS10_9FUNG|nr:hypothetical protein H8356DRAFT_948004 [Neocallimastix sp. JGI-2020a]ORY62027.1 hypothetical protein LY90DRAFT_668433 [Neocallimastix californiae]|eukprot:ORY62027.1 hypothetical protein LY90DRAFT_668433 [Neocallimastix californiae]